MRNFHPRTTAPTRGPLRLTARWIVPAAVLFALGLTLSACQEQKVTAKTALCDVEPIGAVVAMDSALATGTSDFTGVVATLPAPSTTSLSRFTVLDDAAELHIVYYSLPQGTLPIRVGGRYTFHLEHEGRFPPASALVISDDLGLLFAGVSDVAVGQMVVKDGIGDIKLSLLASTCTDRPHDDCLESLRNSALRVTRGSRSAELFHGESVALEGYGVACLTAQEATPGSACADANPIKVSYTIERLPVIP